jgi:phosphoglycolate phosphatase-like HAD superfamily hydrolase
MTPKNLIIFDMDGVIIDVSGSYRDVVRQATKLFFQPARAWEKLPEPLFELSDLAVVKQSGGLNNDWDLTCAVINLLYSMTDRPAVYKSGKPWQRWQETLKHCDISGMAKFLTAEDQPLATLLQHKGKHEDDFIAGLYTGDVGSGNIIKQIFQEIYLGQELFASTYNLKPKLYRGDGYILREKVLIDPTDLAALGRDNMLAIATGRPRAEAEYPLQHFDIKKYYNFIYTLDDCLEAEAKILAAKGETVSLSKPNPFMLDAIAGVAKEKFRHYFYVGDMPDDMLAAANSRFGFKSIGLTVSAPDKSALENELKRAGADFLAGSFDALKAIVL